MITENDLRISSQSYTNKDFEAVYNELLTLAKKISYKYDPTSSNESDPFIVLLKLLAFATDKLNYNVDKNILERFMPSATQESSMNDLTSRLGYNMHYYNSATTIAYFKYKGEIELSTDILIPALSAIIKNDTGYIQYVNIQDIIIDQKTKESGPITLIQGELNTFTVLGNDKIQLENLDQNRRLYFSQSQVAENGVFISGGNLTQNSSWDKVDNLNTQPYNSACYIFRYDSKKNLPYIEFPEWISNLIGEGLSIKYLITAGVNGNVSARSLTTLVYNFPSDSENNISSEDISIINSNGALNGQNTETIDEAYIGFKKTIGTFDTLVSCRDYANFIYNALNSNDIPLVSNVQVSDRRTDINYSRNVVEYDNYGVSVKSETNIREDISPNDLCLYPLKYVSDSSYSLSKGSANYDDTFNPLIDTIEVITNIENNEKALSHNYKSFKEGDIFCIKNYYTLNAILSTTYKVNFLEQQNIIENVKIALTNNFNSRKVDFGYEIPFDTLLQVIQNADERIKSVSLEEPEQKSRALVKTSDNNFKEEDIQKDENNSSNWFKVIVAQNILSGKISLFDYNELFEYDYNQGPVYINDSQQSITDSPLFYNINNISTYTNIGNISSNKSSDPYLLKDNEVIQFIAPNYKSDTVYPYGVNYYLKLADYKKVQIDNVSYDNSSKNLIINYLNTELTGNFSNVNYLNGTDISNYPSQISNASTGSLSNFINTANSEFKFRYGSNYGNQKTEYFPINEGEGSFIAQNETYTLQAGDVLKFWYTDSSGNDVRIRYDNGGKWNDISNTSLSNGSNTVTPNFKMYTSEYRHTPRAAYSRGETPTKENGDQYYYTLSSNQEVVPQEINQEILTEPKYFYWYTNNEIIENEVLKNNIIWKPYYSPSTGDLEYYYYILEENEYLFYTDKNASYLSNYGPGTKLILKGFDFSSGSLNPFQKALERINDISKLIEEGLVGLKDSYFEYIALNESKSLTLQEQEIITLTENDQIYVGENTEITFTDNTFKPLPDNCEIYYITEGEDTIKQLPVRSNNEVKWWARTLLDISAGPSLEQTLLGNQSINIEYFGLPNNSTQQPSSPWYIEDEKTGLIEKGETWIANTSYYILNSVNINSSSTYNFSGTSTTPTFRLSNLMQEGGGENISTIYRDITGKYVYPSLYVYEKESLPEISLKGLQENYYKVLLDSVNTNVSLSVPNLNNDSSAYIMCYVLGANSSSNPLIINTSNNGNLSGFNRNLTIVPDTSGDYYLDNEMTILQLSNIATDLTFTANNSSGKPEELSIIISKPRYVKKELNPLLGLRKDDDIVDFISNNSSTFGNSQIFEKFYATNYIDDSKSIEVSKNYPLNNSLSFYDYNNIGNKWTISQIDFINSDIRIAKSSMK